MQLVASSTASSRRLMRTFLKHNGEPRMCCKTIQKNRKLSAKRQSAKCFYCGLPMWQQVDQQRFAEKYKLTSKQARWFQCTAEHLKAKSEGGNNRRENIVAACKYCNQKRHQYTEAPSPDQYQSLVSKRVAKNKWFPNSLARRLQEDRET